MQMFWAVWYDDMFPYRGVITVSLQDYKFEPLERNPVPTDEVIPTGPKNGMFMKVL